MTNVNIGNLTVGLLVDPQSIVKVQDTIKAIKPLPIGITLKVDKASLDQQLDYISKLVKPITLRVALDTTGLAGLKIAGLTQASTDVAALATALKKLKDVGFKDINTTGLTQLSKLDFTHIAGILPTVVSALNNLKPVSVSVKGLQELSKLNVGAFTKQVQDLAPALELLSKANVSIKLQGLEALSKLSFTQVMGSLPALIAELKTLGEFKLNVNGFKQLEGLTLSGVAGKIEPIITELTRLKDVTTKFSTSSFKALADIKFDSSLTNALPVIVENLNKLGNVTSKFNTSSLAKLSGITFSAEFLKALPVVVEQLNLLGQVTSKFNTTSLKNLAAIDFTMLVTHLPHIVVALNDLSNVAPNIALKVTGLKSLANIDVSKVTANLQALIPVIAQLAAALPAGGININIVGLGGVNAALSTTSSTSKALRDEFGLLKTEYGRLAIGATAYYGELVRLKLATDTEIVASQNLSSSLKTQAAGLQASLALLSPTGLAYASVAERLKQLTIEIGRTDATIKSLSATSSAMTKEMKQFADYAGGDAQAIKKLDTAIVDLTNKFKGGAILSAEYKTELGALKTKLETAATAITSVKGALETQRAGLAANATELPTVIAKLEQATRAELELNAASKKLALGLQEVSQKEALAALGMNAFGQSLIFLPGPLGIVATSIKELAADFALLTGMNKAAVIGLGLAAGAVGLFAVAAYKGVQGAAALEKQQAYLEAITNTNKGGFDDLTAAVQNMSKALPVTSNELYKITEQGAQLGVNGVGGLTKYTDTVAKLGLISHASAEQLGEDLSKFLNETGIDTKSKEYQIELEKVANVLSAVNQNTAATVQSTLSLSKYMAAGSSIYGVTREQILTMAATFSALGARAESGGSAFVGILGKMFQGAQNNTAAFASMAEASGMTNDEFKKLLTTNPAEAFAKFGAALEKTHGDGLAYIDMLDQADIKGIRQIRLFAQTAEGQKILATAQQAATDALQGKIRMDDQVAKSTDNLIDKTTIFNNKLSILEANIGQKILPILTNLVTGLSNVADWADTLGGKITLIGTVVVSVGALLVKSFALNPFATVATGALVLIGYLSTLINQFEEYNKLAMADSVKETQQFTQNAHTMAGGADTFMQQQIRTLATMKTMLGGFQGMLKNEANDSEAYKFLKDRNYQAGQATPQVPNGVFLYTKTTQAEVDKAVKVMDSIAVLTKSIAGQEKITNHAINEFNHQTPEQQAREVSDGSTSPTARSRPFIANINNTIAGGEAGFLDAVDTIASHLKIKGNDLLAVMNFESNLDPQKRNPNSSASGLIQFMESTALELGTTIAAIRKMTAMQQLPYVEKYLKTHNAEGQDLAGLYMSILAGNGDIGSSGKGEVWKRGSKEYAANKGLDINADGIITRIESITRVADHWITLQGKAGYGLSLDPYSKTQPTNINAKPLTQKEKQEKIEGEGKEYSRQLRLLDSVTDEKEYKKIFDARAALDTVYKKANGNIKLLHELEKAAFDAMSPLNKEKKAAIEQYHQQLLLEDPKTNPKMPAVGDARVVYMGKIDATKQKLEKSYPDIADATKYMYGEQDTLKVSKDSKNLAATTSVIIERYKAGQLKIEKALELLGQIKDTATSQGNDLQLKTGITPTVSKYWAIAAEASSEIDKLNKAVGKAGDNLQAGKQSAAELLTQVMSGNADIARANADALGVSRQAHREKLVSSEADKKELLALEIKEGGLYYAARAVQYDKERQEAESAEKDRHAAALLTIANSAADKASKISQVTSENQINKQKIALNVATDTANKKSLKTEKDQGLADAQKAVVEQTDAYNAKLSDSVDKYIELRNKAMESTKKGEFSDDQLKEFNKSVVDFKATLEGSKIDAGSFFKQYGSPEEFTNRATAMSKFFFDKIQQQKIGVEVAKMEIEGAKGQLASLELAEKDKLALYGENAQKRLDIINEYAPKLDTANKKVFEKERALLNAEENKRYEEEVQRLHDLGFKDESSQLNLEKGLHGIKVQAIKDGTTQELALLKSDQDAKLRQATEAAEKTTKELKKMSDQAQKAVIETTISDDKHTIDNLEAEKNAQLKVYEKDAQGRLDVQNKYNPLIIAANKAMLIKQQGIETTTEANTNADNLEVINSKGGSTTDEDKRHTAVMDNIAAGTTESLLKIKRDLNTTETEAVKAADKAMEDLQKADDTVTESRLQGRVKDTKDELTTLELALSDGLAKHKDEGGAQARLDLLDELAPKIDAANKKIFEQEQQLEEFKESNRYAAEKKALEVDNAGKEKLENAEHAHTEKMKSIINGSTLELAKLKSADAAKSLEATKAVSEEVEKIEQLSIDGQITREEGKLTTLDSNFARDMVSAKEDLVKKIAVEKAYADEREQLQNKIADLTLIKGQRALNKEYEPLLKEQPDNQLIIGSKADKNSGLLATNLAARLKNASESRDRIIEMEKKQDEATTNNVTTQEQKTLQITLENAKTNYTTLETTLSDELKLQDKSDADKLNSLQKYSEQRIILAKAVIVAQHDLDAKVLLDDYNASHQKLADSGQDTSGLEKNYKAQTDAGTLALNYSLARADTENANEIELAKKAAAPKSLELLRTTEAEQAAFRLTTLKNNQADLERLRDEAIKKAKGNNIEKYQIEQAYNSLVLGENQKVVDEEYQQKVDAAMRWYQEQALLGSGKASLPAYQEKISFAILERNTASGEIKNKASDRMDNARDAFGIQWTAEQAAARKVILENDLADTAQNVKDKEGLYNKAIIAAKSSGADLLTVESVEGTALFEAKQASFKAIEELGIENLKTAYNLVVANHGNAELALKDFTREKGKLLDATKNSNVLLTAEVKAHYKTNRELADQQKLETDRRTINTGLSNKKTSANTAFETAKSASELGNSTAELAKAGNETEQFKLKTGLNDKLLEADRNNLLAQQAIDDQAAQEKHDDAILALKKIRGDVEALNKEFDASEIVRKAAQAVAVKTLEAGYAKTNVDLIQKYNLSMKDLSASDRQKNLTDIINTAEESAQAYKKEYADHLEEIGISDIQKEIYHDKYAKNILQQEKNLNILRENLEVDAENNRFNALTDDQQKLQSNINENGAKLLAIHQKYLKAKETLDVDFNKTDSVVKTSGATERAKLTTEGTQTDVNNLLSDLDVMSGPERTSLLATLKDTLDKIGPSSLATAGSIKVLNDAVKKVGDTTEKADKSLQDFLDKMPEDLNLDMEQKFAAIGKVDNREDAGVKAATPYNNLATNAENMIAQYNKLLKDSSKTLDKDTRERYQHDVEILTKWIGMLKTVGGEKSAEAITDFVEKEKHDTADLTEKGAAARFNASKPTQDNSFGGIGKNIITGLFGEASTNPAWKDYEKAMVAQRDLAKETLKAENATAEAAMGKVREAAINLAASQTDKERTRMRARLDEATQKANIATDKQIDALNALTSKEEALAAFREKGLKGIFDKGFEGSTQAAVGSGLNLVSQVGGLVNPLGLLAQIIEKISPVAEILSATFSVLEPIIRALKEPLEEVGLILGRALEPVLKLLVPIFEAFAPMLEAVITSLEPLIAVVADVITPVMVVLGNVMKAVANIFTGIYDAIIGFLTSLPFVGSWFEGLKRDTSKPQTAADKQVSKNTLDNANAKTEDDFKAGLIGYKEYNLERYNSTITRLNSEEEAEIKAAGTNEALKKTIRDKYALQRHEAEASMLNANADGEIAALKDLHDKGLISEEEYQRRVVSAKTSAAIAIRDAMLSGETDPARIKAINEQYTKTILGITADATKANSDSQLNALKDLHDKGLISEKDYADQVYKIKVDAAAAARDAALVGVTDPSLINAINEQYGRVVAGASTEHNKLLVDSQLNQLKELHDKGLISEKDYADQVYEIKKNAIDAAHTLALVGVTDPVLIKAINDQYSHNTNQNDSEHITSLNNVEIKALDRRLSQGLISETEYEKEVYRIKMEGLEKQKALVLSDASLTTEQRLAVERSYAEQAVEIYQDTIGKFWSNLGKTISDSITSAITKGFSDAAKKGDFHTFKGDIKKEISSILFDAVVSAIVQTVAISAFITPAVKALTDALQTGDNNLVDKAITGILTAGDRAIAALSTFMPRLMGLGTKLGINADQNAGKILKPTDGKTGGVFVRTADTIGSSATANLSKSPADLSTMIANNERTIYNLKNPNATKGSEDPVVIDSANLNKTPAQLAKIIADQETLIDLIKYPYNADGTPKSVVGTAATAGIAGTANDSPTGSAAGSAGATPASTPINPDSKLPVTIIKTEGGKPLNVKIVEDVTAVATKKPLIGSLSVAATSMNDMAPTKPEGSNFELTMGKHIDSFGKSVGRFDGIMSRVEKAIGEMKGEPPKKTLRADLSSVSSRG